MRPDQERAAVIAEAISWVGTPYHANARIKGVGVDCAMLLAEVYNLAGVLGRIEPGAYAADFALHRSDEIFLGWVQRFAFEIDQPRPGDVAVFKFGRCFSHGAILIDDAGQLVHALAPCRAVVRGALGAGELAGRPVKFFSVWGA